MKLECIQFKRCCFCLPLRYGLLVTGYLSLAVCMLALSFIVGNLPTVVRGRENNRTSVLILLSTNLVFYLLCAALNIVFIVGGHKKSAHLMSVYYKYSIVILVLLFLELVGTVAFDIYISISYELSLDDLVHLLHGSLLSDIATICFQVYMIFLTRSEKEKLKNNHTFSFVNNAVEVECKMLKELGDGNLASDVAVVEDVEDEQDETLYTLETVNEKYTKKNGNYVKLN